MGKHFDKLFEDMKADLESTEDKAEHQETPAEPQEQPREVENPPEPPKDTTEPETEPERTETAQDEPAPEPEKRDIPDDPLKRAEFSFKRQLEKKDKKHAAELAERDKKYEELSKKFEELEKKMTPPEKPKTRDEFPDDEEFMDYKVDRRFNQKMAEFEAERQKQEAERAEQERKRMEAEEQLRQEQETWISNVNEAFDGDQERSKNFLAKVAYANKNGLGQILDSCPVAADYLLHDPYGPVVFEKLLTDKQTFDRIFDPRRPSPLAVYHELRAVEDELKAPKEEPKPATVVPKMGRPGRQSGGMSVTNNDMWSDPKAIKKWLREHK